MNHYIDIIDGIKDLFIEMNKGIVFFEEICLVINKYKNLLNELNGGYRCIRYLIIDDNLIEKIRIHIQNIMFLWRELKLPVASSAHLLQVAY